MEVVVVVEVEGAFEILGVEAEEEEDATGLLDEAGGAGDAMVGVETDDAGREFLETFLRLRIDFELALFFFLGASSSLELELELDLLLSSSDDDVSILFDFDLNDFLAFFMGAGLTSSDVTVRVGFAGESSSCSVRGEESGSGSFLFIGACDFGLGLVLISSMSSESSDSGSARSLPLREGTDGREAMGGSG